MFDSGSKENYNLKKIGELMVEGETNHLIVSDPSYSREQEELLACRVANPREGKWIGYIDWLDEDARVKTLFLVNESILRGLNGDEWKFQKSIGVDSAQCVISLLQDFRQDSKIDASKIVNGFSDGDDLYYDACCDITLDYEYSAGMLPGGIVSRTGYGDGVYPVFVMKSGGIPIAVKIEFIFEEIDKRHTRNYNFGLAEDYMSRGMNKFQT